MTTLAEKRAYLGSDFVNIFGFDATANIRNNSSLPAYPLQIHQEPLIPVVTSLPALPNATYPIQSAVRVFSTGVYWKNVANVWTQLQAAQFNIDNTWAPGQANARSFIQGGLHYQPTVDNAFYYGPGGGTGSIRIEIPSGCDQNAGGYVHLTLLGNDQGHIAVSPSTIKKVICFQFKRFSLNTVQNFGGSFPNSYLKDFIFAGAPNANYQFGSDPATAFVIEQGAGWTVGTRNGLPVGYTRDDATSGPNAGQYHADNTERMIGPTLYLQDGCGCPYSDPSVGNLYPSPPCRKVQDGIWQEFTGELEFQPVASDFFTSGTGATLNRSTPTFDSLMVGRYVYISGAGGGYFRITQFNSVNSVTIESGASVGTGKTVYISGYPNTKINFWLDGPDANGNPTISHNDQKVVWDYDGDSLLVGFGAIRFQPHMTLKTAGMPHTAGTVWYDDYIIATARIPMVSTTEREANYTLPGKWSALVHSETDGFLPWTNKMQGQSGAAGAVGSMIAFTSQGWYDKVRDRSGVCSSPHYGGSPQPLMDDLIIDHAADTATFRRVAAYSGTVPFSVFPTGHAYMSNAANPVLRKRYFSMKVDTVGYPNTLNEVDLDTDVLNPSGAPHPQTPLGEPVDAFFEAKNEFLRFQGNILRKLVGGVWTTINTFTNSEHGIDGPCMLVNDVAGKVCIYGGGSGFPPVVQVPCRVHSYDSAGIIAPMANAPANFKLCTNSYVAMNDPASSKNIFVIALFSGTTWGPPAITGIEMWSHDVITDTYTQLPTTDFPARSLWWQEDYPFALIVMALSRYGVIQFISGATVGIGGANPNAKSSIYFYRPSAGIFFPQLPDPPTLTSLSPSSGDVGTTVSCTLTGTNFNVGTPIVTITKIGGSGVTLGTVVVNSSTSITVPIIIGSGATTGVWEVRVQTTNGTTGPQNFTVNTILPPSPIKYVRKMIRMQGI